MIRRLRRKRDRAVDAAVGFLARQAVAGLDRVQAAYLHR